MRSDPYVPAELAALPQWVAWRYGKVRPTAKREKVPINPATGRAASVTDPRTWGTLEDARAARDRYRLAGIGFVLTLAAGFVVVDLDACHNPETGDLQYLAALRIGRLDSFTEVSPSGTGIHVWMRGTLPPGRRRCDGVEVYETERYICFTGRLISDSPDSIHERTPELKSFHEEVFGEDDQAEAGEPDHTQPVCSSPLADNAVIGLAQAASTGARFNRLWNGDRSGYASESEADMRLCGLLAEHTTDAAQIDRLFRRSGLLRDKWERKDYAEGTIAKAVAGRTVHERAYA